MGLEVTINGIIGTSPYDLYICQPNGNGCFYISTISSTPYSFIIPPPYDTGLAYMLKVIDTENCIISGITSIT
jgi:hypothetical protein